MFLFSAKYNVWYIPGGENMRNIDVIDEEDYLEDFDFYSEDLRDKMMEEDEISSSEAAFMQGYDQAD